MYQQSTVTTKGQITIPAEMRKALGLKPGDKVSFGLEDRSIRIEPAKSSLLKGYGTVKLRGGTKDLKQTRRETERWVAEQAMKEM